MDFELINQSALEALSKNELYQAQTLFRHNAKKNPCFATLNNLGVFRVNEGIILQNGRVRNAVKLGIGLLRRAEVFKISGANLAATASAYYEIKDFKMAVHYYERTNKVLADYICINNYGTALYSVKSYEKAAELLLKALNKCPDDGEKQEIIVSYAYTMLNIDKQECCRIITDMITPDVFSSQMLEVDRFVILYLCEDYTTASIVSKTLFPKYSIDNQVFAMIIDCFLKLGQKDEAKECVRLQIEALQGYDYDTSKEIRSANRSLASSNYRTEIISEYRYFPSIIKQCCYYGCKQHNPL